MTYLSKHKILSYREFIHSHNLKDCDESLELYFKVGGLPQLAYLSLDSHHEVRNALEEAYSSIIFQDILLKQPVRNIKALNKVVESMAAYVGRTFTVRKLANYIQQEEEKVSLPALTAYMEYLCDTGLITLVKEFDIKANKQLEQNFKCYFADNGLLRFLGGNNPLSRIKNMVFNELVNQGFAVSTGYLRNGEIDFVATRGNQKIYIQASYLIASEETKQREFGNLDKIRDHNPKYVVSMDPFGGEFPEYPGIKLIPLREFLTTNW